MMDGSGFHCQTYRDYLTLRYYRNDLDGLDMIIRLVLHSSFHCYIRTSITSHTQDTARRPAHT